MKSELEKAQEEINELRSKLDQWNYEYYVLDDPSVSDAVYDKAMQRLIALENLYPQLKTPNSPSCRVGGYVSEKFEKIRHLKPMMSLSNAFSDDDLLKFDADIKKEVHLHHIEYVVEPKIDGLSISLVYENAKLVRAVTRGDGTFGEDVTANVLTIKSIPVYLSEKYKNITVEVRGEVYMDKSDFEQLNSSLPEGQKPFANPRNAAAGSLRNLDSSIAAQRNLKALFYYLPNAKEMGLNSQWEVIAWLRDNKFPTAKNIFLVPNAIEMIHKVEHFSQIRSTLDYQIDGVVIKVNDYTLYDEIGFTSKFPKWAIAYKFPAEIGLTELLDIVADVGRTGKITYVGVMKPILLDGSTVSKVTLNNAEYIHLKDIRIGDWVYVYKAGDVIPYLDYVDLNKRKPKAVIFEEITQCPVCGTALIRFNDEVDQRCPNYDCPAQVVKRIDYFCSRDCMNIQNISLSIIQKFYEHGFLKDITDLYKLGEHYEAIVSADLKIKDKSLTNILNNINASKKNSLEKLLCGLGIRHLGKTIAKKLASYFKNLEHIQDATYEQLISIQDVGEILANEIVTYFKNPVNITLINELKTLGLNFDYHVDLSGLEDINIVEEYKHKTFVITGTFSIPRDQIKHILETAYSAKVVSSISKKVNYLLAGEDGGSKLMKAEELGIPVITNEFWKR